MTCRSRGAVLLEMLAALGLFVAAGLAVIGATRRALASVESARETAFAADLAGSALDLLRAGAATPESLSGPADPRSAPSDAGLTADSDARADTAWSLRVETEPSVHDGLTAVRITALLVLSDGSERSVAEVAGLYNVRRAVRAQ